MIKAMNPETIAWAYPFALYTHISLVIASVCLFAARGLGVLTGQDWPMRQVWRGLSVWIDTALLSAGGLLWFMLQFNPWHDHWLTTKLVLLVVYVVLGSLALKRGRSARMRTRCYGAAVLVYLAMIGIARAHHPLGWIHSWLG